MPLAVKVFGERELIWVEGEGVVTDHDLVTYVHEYLVEKNLRSWDEVFDLSSADLLDVTYAGLSEVAAAAVPTDPEESPTKIAILISEAVGIGVSRMYQTLREGKGGRRAMRIFWEREDLLAWMELPPGWIPGAD
ncbi:MAG: hypothetical protein PVJ04_04265 [Gemmatimonadota bacterium]|jgi:hypothetical protein